MKFLYIVLDMRSLRGVFFLKELLFNIVEDLPGHVNCINDRMWMPEEASVTSEGLYKNTVLSLKDMSIPSLPLCRDQTTLGFWMCGSALCFKRHLDVIGYTGIGEESGSGLAGLGCCLVSSLGKQDTNPMPWHEEAEHRRLTPRIIGRWGRCFSHYEDVNCPRDPLQSSGSSYGDSSSDVSCDPLYAALPASRHESWKINLWIGMTL